MDIETQPENLDGESLKPTYDQIEQMYFAQCEATDEWADKYKLSQEENEKLIHDLSEYISIANISTTQLAQSQAEKAELVRQCAQICESLKEKAGRDFELQAWNSALNTAINEILSLLPND